MGRFFSPFNFLFQHQNNFFASNKHCYHWCSHETTQVVGFGFALAAHNWYCDLKQLKETMIYEDTSKWALIYFINKCFLLTFFSRPSVLFACLSLDVWAGKTTGPWPSLDLSQNKLRQEVNKLQQITAASLLIALKAQISKCERRKVD